MVIRESDTYNAAFPAKRIADVTLVLNDGRELRSGPTEALGDPENPVSLDTVISKYYAYAEPILGQARAHDIQTHVLSLGEEDDLTALLSLLTTAV
jgi:2-methylcitrate dehydratase PrpD